jgi:hypothetical protein
LVAEHDRLPWVRGAFVEEDWAVIYRPPEPLADRLARVDQWPDFDSGHPIRAAQLLCGAVTGSEEQLTAFVAMMLGDEWRGAFGWLYTLCELLAPWKEFGYVPHDPLEPHPESGDWRPTNSIRDVPRMDHLLSGRQPEDNPGLFPRTARQHGAVPWIRDALREPDRPATAHPESSPHPAEAGEPAAAAIELPSPAPDTAPASDGKKPPHTAKPGGAPRKLLTGWHELTAGVGLRYPERNKLKSLNARWDGPIKHNGPGTHPFVYADELLDWWNTLDIREQDAANQRAGATLSAKDQHFYGRDGKAAPGVGGGVKKRRRGEPT